MYMYDINYILYLLCQRFTINLRFNLNFSINLNHISQKRDAYIVPEIAQFGIKRVTFTSGEGWVLRIELGLLLDKCWCNIHISVAEASISYLYMPFLRILLTFSTIGNSTPSSFVTNLDTFGTDIIIYHFSILVKILPPLLLSFSWKPFKFFILLVKKMFSFPPVFFFLFLQRGNAFYCIMCLRFYNRV